jgi:hypothetical protein
VKNLNLCRDLFELEETACLWKSVVLAFVSFSVSGKREKIHILTYPIVTGTFSPLESSFLLLRNHETFGLTVFCSAFCVRLDSHSKKKKLERKQKKHTFFFFLQPNNSAAEEKARYALVSSRFSFLLRVP